MLSNALNILEQRRKPALDAVLFDPCQERHDVQRLNS